MRNPFSVWSIALVASLAAAACGGGDAQPVVPPAPTAMESAAPAASAAPAESAAPPPASAAPVASAAPSAPPGPVWKDDMTKEQKAAYMKANVAPRMKAAFAAKDAKKWGDFGCKNCHGSTHKASKDFLPKLTLKDGKLTAFADKPEIAKFMHETVVPEMSAALGLKPYDPATNTGFGCAGCHTIEKK